jgi:zinc protease
LITPTMSRARWALGATCGALLALGAGTAHAADTARLPKPQRLNFKERKLSNGLKVVTLEDHSAPVVTLQVWYHVGSKDEPSGKAGFAHLFEHLMFKGSKNVPNGGHTRYVEQLGGDYNANTSFDRTLFYETVPSSALERVLFLEADRMASLNVDEANMKSERDVVKEEHRLDVENAPYGTLFERVQSLIFPATHPYAHTTIGIMADLDNAKLDDVRAFHDEYYRPDDATLVLVGDFKTDLATAAIRRYFESIPKSAKPFTRYPAPPMTQSHEEAATWYDKLAPLPAIGVAFAGPPANDPDSPVFEVISQILSSGQSSRLYRSMVRDRQLAVQVSGDNLALKLGSIFFFFTIANPGKTPDDVEKALLEQVDLLRNEPVSAAELTKAKNQVLTSKVFGTLSTEQKASLLGEADLDYGNPGEANKEFDEITKVSAQDVQRVARKYFAPERRNVFYMLPESMRAGAAHTANGPNKEVKP